MRAVPVLLVLALLVPASADAEAWPTFEDYVNKCAVIVKAKMVWQMDNVVEYDVTEVWAGQAEDVPLNDRGRYWCYKDEHGAKTALDQEIVFFFTRHNMIQGKIVRHSTGFPIVDGKLVYAVTSELRAEYTVDDFKAKILEIRKAQAARQTP